MNRLLFLFCLCLTSIIGCGGGGAPEVIDTSDIPADIQAEYDKAYAEQPVNEKNNK